jgi:hypothetical protein
VAVVRDSSELAATEVWKLEGVEGNTVDAVDSVVDTEQTVVVANVVEGQEDEDVDDDDEEDELVDKESAEDDEVEVEELEDEEEIVLQTS